MRCSPPGSTIHGISQARVLQWAAISFSRGSSKPRDQTQVSRTGRWILCHWATWEARAKLGYWCEPTLKKVNFIHCYFDIIVWWHPVFYSRNPHLILRFPSVLLRHINVNLHFLHGCKRALQVGCIIFQCLEMKINRFIVPCDHFSGLCQGGIQSSLRIKNGIWRLREFNIPHCCFFESLM